MGRVLQTNNEGHGLNILNLHFNSFWNWPESVRLQGTKHWSPWPVYLREVEKFKKSDCIIFSRGSRTLVHRPKPLFNYINNITYALVFLHKLKNQVSQLRILIKTTQHEFPLSFDFLSAKASSLHVCVIEQLLLEGFVTLMMFTQYQQIRSSILNRYDYTHVTSSVSKGS